MSKLRIAGQEFARAWSPSGSQGLSCKCGVFAYELIEPWRSAARRLEAPDVVSTAKSLALGAIIGNEPLKSNGETPRRLIPRSMALDFWSMTTLNCWGHSAFGLRHHLWQGTFEQIPKPWVLSLVSDQSEWEQKKREFEIICALLKSHEFAFDVRPVLEIVGGCPNAEISLENIMADNARLIALVRGLMPGWIIGNNITPIAPPAMFQSAQDAGADYIRLCNTFPHGDSRLPKNIRWANASPLQKRVGKPGSYSGPPCAPIILEVLDCIRPLIHLPIGVGNGFYTVKLIEEAYRRGADFISLGMIKLYRPWRLNALIEAANSLK